MPAKGTQWENTELYVANYDQGPYKGVTSVQLDATFARLLGGLLVGMEVDGVLVEL